MTMTQYTVHTARTHKLQHTHLFYYAFHFVKRTNRGKMPIHLLIRTRFGFLYTLSVYSLKVR